MPPHDAARKEEQERRAKKCPRCQGKGYRILIVGPHTEYGIGVPGGPARYDCRLCKGTGKVGRKPIPAEQMRKEVDG
jgi:hypothetical protein